MASAQSPTKNPPSSPSAGNHTCGRYQVFFSPHARADAYLVDTETGRIWEKVTYSNLVGEPEAWLPLARIDNDIELNDWLKKQQFKPKPEVK